MKSSRRFVRLVRVSSSWVLPALLFVAVGCDGGGGGGLPAAPAPAFPQVAGSWSGDFVVPEEPEPAFLSVRLSQVDASVAGTVSVEGFDIPVSGTLTARDAQGEGVLTWAVDPASLACGSWTGTLVVSQSDTRMQGPSRLSDAGCDDATGPLEGTITLSKSVGADALSSTGSERSPFAGRLAKLVSEPK